MIVDKLKAWKKSQHGRAVQFLTIDEVDELADMVFKALMCTHCGHVSAEPVIHHKLFKAICDNCGRPI